MLRIPIFGYFLKLHNMTFLFFVDTQHPLVTFLAQECSQQDLQRPCADVRVDWRHEHRVDDRARRRGGLPGLGHHPQSAALCRWHLPGDMGLENTEDLCFF